MLQTAKKHSWQDVSGAFDPVLLNDVAYNLRTGATFEEVVNLGWPAIISLSSNERAQLKMKATKLARSSSPLT